PAEGSPPLRLGSVPARAGGAHGDGAARGAWAPPPFHRPLRASARRGGSLRAHASKAPGQGDPAARAVTEPANSSRPDFARKPFVLGPARFQGDLASPGASKSTSRSQVSMKHDKPPVRALQAVIE